jgi:hypothetical protein
VTAAAAQTPVARRHHFIPTWEGWLDLAKVTDIAACSVVDDAMAGHLCTELIPGASANAVTAHDPRTLSDLPYRGSAECADGGAHNVDAGDLAMLDLENGRAWITPSASASSELAGDLGPSSSWPGRSFGTTASRLALTSATYSRCHFAAY